MIKGGHFTAFLWKKGQLVKSSSARVGTKIRKECLLGDFLERTPFYFY